MNNILHDLRYALRSLRKSPAFAAVTILSLGLGIGANTAIFSVVNGVLLKPPPYRDAERLVILWEANPSIGTTRNAVSGPNFIDWRERAKSFEEMALFEAGTGTMTGGAEPEQVPALRVTVNFLSMLGQHVQLGRDFLPEEGHGGRANVVIVSSSYWQRRWGGNPRFPGTKAIGDGITYTGIGVLSEDFWFPVRTDLLVPWDEDELLGRSRSSRDNAVLARLREGVSIEQAQAEMNAIASQLEREHTSQQGWGVNVTPFHETGTAFIRPALLALLGAVGFVLLIACANVANLLLARAAARRREVAIRLAAGASQGRMVRQFLTESVVLGLLGGGVGLLLGVWGIELLTAVLPSTIPIPDVTAEILLPEVGVDRSVLLFTLGVSLLTGLLFGLAPALQVSSIGSSEALKQTGRGGVSARGQSRTRMMLVASEVALAMVLLIGTALMMQAFWRIRTIDAGFQPSGLLTMQLEVPTDTKYRTTEERAEFYRRVVEQMQALPGVEAAGISEILPLDGESRRGAFTLESGPAAVQDQKLGADYNSANSGFFQALRIPLLEGRLFEDRDRFDAPAVAIVDRRFADTFFPNESPVGRRVKFGRPREIVGVVGPVHSSGLNEQPRPTIYFPYQQAPDNRMSFALRTQGDPTALIRAAKQAVWKVDPDQPVFRIHTMEEVVAQSTSAARLTLILLGVFGAVALVMAVLGVYGVMSYSVSQRIHEIGLRQVLGAEPSSVLKMVVREGLLITLLGVGLGVFAALAVTRALASLLFGVSATNPWAFGVVAAVLLMVAAAASYVPARRAAKVDPMEALRYE